MASDTVLQTRSPPVLVSELLGPAERAHVERLLQWLRLSLLITALLVLVTTGARAITVAVWIVVAAGRAVTPGGRLRPPPPALLLRTPPAPPLVVGRLIFIVPLPHRRDV